MAINDNYLPGTSNGCSGHSGVGRLAYSVPEASAAIGIGKTKIYELIQQGSLPSTLIGKRRLIRAADLEALISGQLPLAA